MVEIERERKGVYCTPLFAVRPRLPLALEFIMTLGQELFRRSGINALVTRMLDVTQLLKLRLEHSLSSTRFSDLGS